MNAEKGIVYVCPILPGINQAGHYINRHSFLFVHFYHFPDIIIQLKKAEELTG